jgi:pSer/pThr/pTyr-binding forkhead associated (FHA) protein
MASDRVLCPECSLVNVPGATECARCGAPLQHAPELATSTISALGTLRPLTKHYALSQNEVLFLIAGQQDPIIITMHHDRRDVQIGRGVGGDNPPDLDLGALSEMANSVSRHHARLDFHRNQALIVDLGSTNGTWLNENRLIPNTPHELRNGDLIRIGQQFMYVYFASELEAVDIITLTDHSTSSPQYTPDLLIRVADYLRVLVTIQHLYQTVQLQPLTEVTINAIKVNHAPRETRIRLAHATPALQLVTKVVTPWRKHQHAVSKATHNNQRQDKLIQLTKTHLTEIAPDMTTLEQANFVQQVLPHLHSLALHPLRLAIVPSWD